MSSNKISANTFSEIGIDPDNNKLLLGRSSEIEFEDGTEIRYKKWLNFDNILHIYFRIWLFKKVFGVSFNLDQKNRKKEKREIITFWQQRKNRNNFKIVFGIGGYRKNTENI